MQAKSMIASREIDRMASQVVLALGGLAVRIADGIEHEVPHYGVEDREVTEERLEGASADRAGAEGEGQGAVSVRHHIATGSSIVEGNYRHPFYAVLHLGGRRSPLEAVRAAIVAAERRHG